MYGQLICMQAKVSSLEGWRREYETLQEVYRRAHARLPVRLFGVCRQLSTFESLCGVISSRKGEPTTHLRSLQEPLIHEGL